MGTKKLLYCNIDGFSYRYFEQLNHIHPDGPFSRLASQGMLFSNLRSGLISITNPMQSAILCGAWSNHTHNFYQHYDWASGTVVKHRRTCDAENAGQRFRRAGKTAASIHQFLLEGNPCQPGDPECAYLTCPGEHSDALERLDLLEALLQGHPVLSGGRRLVFPSLPDFTAVYVDDIDSLGHNNPLGPYPKRQRPEQRQSDLLERLTQIGERLEELVTLCRQLGLYEDLLILITTDHGMTTFSGASQLPNLLQRLNAAGIPAAVPENRTDATRVVVLPYTMEASLYCAPDILPGERLIIDRVCRDLPCIDRVFLKEEMQNLYGLDPRGPDFLLSPKPGSHFYHRDIPQDTFAGGHDSFDETSQHIFGLLLGGAVLPGSVILRETQAIDLLPTLLARFFGMAMADQTGQIWTDWPLRSGV